jgi:hypothetical protein
MVLENQNPFLLEVSRVETIEAIWRGMVRTTVARVPADVTLPIHQTA